ncbi:MAG TPA: VCBS repeat-containing protein [Acidisarcina sp.]
MKVLHILPVSLVLLCALSVSGQQVTLTPRSASMRSDKGLADSKLKTMPVSRLQRIQEELKSARLSGPDRLSASALVEGGKFAGALSGTRSGTSVGAHLGSGGGRRLNGAPESSTQSFIQNTGTGPAATAVGDFNGDGKVDYAIAMAGDNSIWIYMGNGDGTTQLPVVVPVQGSTITSNRSSPARHGI